MLITLNLATEAFGRTRLFWFLSGVSGLILVTISGWLLAVHLQEKKISPNLLIQERHLHSELNNLEESEHQLKVKLEELDTDHILERSLFLNQLLHRKGISWTHTFADLEKTLPPRVQIFQVRPQVTPDHKVLLEMQVGAETPKDFVELLKMLESSQLFGAADLRGNSPPTENQPLFRYQLMVSYAQKL